MRFPGSGPHTQAVPGIAIERLTACEQFPGGGIGTGLGFGFGIPVFGSGGAFTGGIRGGLIPGGGFVAGAGSGIGPVLTLEAAFDVGFTSAEIAATILREEAEIRAGLSEGREAVITISTGQQSGLTMVLDLAKGLFEIFDRDGRKLGGGVTPEAAIAAVNAGAPPLGGGGGSEPLPFPRQSLPLPPLPLSHLRRSPRPSVKTSSARSKRSSASCNQGESRRRADSRPYRPVCPSNRYYLVERSTSPWSWARRVIPPAYVVRAFQIKSNSPERNRSAASSRSSWRLEKLGRTRTSSAEHLSSSLPHGWN